MSGLMPGAVLKLIPPGDNDPAILPVGVNFHIAVSNADSLYEYFAHQSGGIESHFYVRLTGTIEQYRSIYREADAQDKGNSFIVNGVRKGLVSVESEGMGKGKWTLAQLEAFKRIVNFVHSKRAFPLRVCPEWNRGGIGYHSLFPEWNPHSHSCPGPERIVQFNNYLVPWLGFTPVHLNSFRLGTKSEDALKVKLELHRRGYSGFRYSGVGKYMWGLGAQKAWLHFEQDCGIGRPNISPNSASLHLLGFRVI